MEKRKPVSALRVLFMLFVFEMTAKGYSDSHVAGTSVDHNLISSDFSDSNRNLLSVGNDHDENGKVDSSKEQEGSGRSSRAAPAPPPPRRGSGERACRPAPPPPSRGSSRRARRPAPPPPRGNRPIRGRRSAPGPPPLPPPPPPPPCGYC